MSDLLKLNDSIEQQKKILHTTVDYVYQEAHDKTKRREQLESLMSSIQSGDTLFVTDFFILADSTKQLVDLINEAINKGVVITILNKELVIDSENTFTFRHSLNLISEFQSDVVKFRTRLGMNEAATKGKQLGRPKRSDDNIKQAIKMYMSKEYTLDEIKQQTNISRATLYRHLDL
ncbi:recombinase family protein [Salinicoccus sesuvii]|uniref:Recombinase family protein n=1 Tax=Salinicoccus sesuvii TaxID=868281 RepID=A0ABV7NAZ2_9STAP